jgi:hypothetical protein
MAETCGRYFVVLLSLCCRGRQQGPIANGLVMWSSLELLLKLTELTEC